MKVIGLIISLAVMMVSCNWQRPFNRQLWDEVGDLESSPFRKENQVLSGKKWLKTCLTTI